MITFAALFAEHPAQNLNRAWPTGTEQPDWVLDAINLPRHLRADGRQIHLVDTGLASPDHPELAAEPPGAIRPGRALVHPPPKPQAPGNELIDHGMAMASVIASARRGGVQGVAPGATVTVHQVHNWPVLSTPESRKAAAAAVEAAIVQGADVISISMGFVWAGKALRDAIARAEGRGVIVIAAAGQFTNRDDGIPCPLTLAPGCLDTVICAAAINIHKQACAWSGHGDAVDILAPGDGVWAARNFKGQDMAHPRDPALFALQSGGTSFSTAITAGAAALWLNQHPDLPRAQRPRLFRRAIRSAGLQAVTHTSKREPIGDPDDWGHGILDVDRLRKADLNLATRDLETCGDALDEVVSAVDGYHTGAARKQARARLARAIGANSEEEAVHRLEEAGDDLAAHVLDQKGWKNLGLNLDNPLPNAPLPLRKAILGDRA